MITIAELIRTRCLTRTGHLNNRCCQQSWWANRHLLAQYIGVLEQTAWLPESVKFSERLYGASQSLRSSPPCQICLQGRAAFLSFQEGYSRYCSAQCATQCPDRNQKIGAHRDMGAIMEKIKVTNLRRYGVDHYFQTAEAIQKGHQTKVLRYGDPHYHNSAKMQETNLLRYGVAWASQSPDVIRKMQETKTKTCPELRDRNWLMTENRTKTVTQIAQELGVAYRTVYLWFGTHQLDINFFQPHYGAQQQEVLEFVESLGILDIRGNDRTVIKPKELDLYLPAHRLGIEFNGMFWHANDRLRHHQKRLLCHAQGIRLLQIWDVEWITARPIVESIIRAALGRSTVCMARRCEVRDLDQSTYRAFLDLHHLQGWVGSPIRRGLWYQGELLSVMGVGKPRFGQRTSHELLRFATAQNRTITGGFNKLLLAIRRAHPEIHSLITYADLRYFTGQIYQNNGFVFSHHTPPGYVYYKQGLVKSRFQFQKRQLARWLPGFDPSRSESENAQIAGWVKVWDCGQAVFHL